MVSDAKGVGLAHIKHSQLMRDVIAIGQKNYPEMVQSVLVVRAPLYMHTLWNFGVKWVLNERVKRKVAIAGKRFEKKMTPVTTQLALPYIFILHMFVLLKLIHFYTLDYLGVRPHVLSPNLIVNPPFFFFFFLCIRLVLTSAHSPSTWAVLYATVT